MKWRQENIPDQAGRIAIGTGANTGIGYETARALAQKGAEVTLACRSREKGETAVQRIAAEQPRGSVVFAALDLADLDSVRDFAVAFAGMHDRLDLLVNNAGVMVPPESKTKQGFELQRRFEAEGVSAFAVAAHPGWTGTDLQRNAWYVRLMNVLVAMSPPQGALPTLRAATADDVEGGEYYGPHGYREMRGYPVRVGTSEAAKNADDAAQLWQVSEELTGVTYALSAARLQERQSCSGK